MGAESGVWKVKSGVWKVKSGVWRVELKALGCLPCKGGGPQSGGGVLIKGVESGVEGTRLPPLQGRGTAERWRGFD